MIGDKNVTFRDVTGAQISVHSRDVRQKMITETLASQPSELKDLVNLIYSETAKLPEERRDDSDRIEQAVETVVAELGKQKKSESFLNRSIAGLKEAAEAVNDIAPVIFATALNVATFIANTVRF